MPEEDAQADRRKKTLILLVGGAALLILPLLIIIVSKFLGPTTTAALQDGSFFDARSVKIGSRIPPAQTPAPTPRPSGIPARAVNPLKFIVGYRETPAHPSPRKAPEPEITARSRRTLTRISPRKPSRPAEFVPMPRLKPNPFGNSPAPQPGVPQTPDVSQILNGVMKETPGGGAVPPNIQQIIQQQTQKAAQQNSAPQVPPPNPGP